MMLILIFIVMMQRTQWQAFKQILNIIWLRPHGLFLTDVPMLICTHKQDHHFAFNLYERFTVGNSKAAFRLALINLRHIPKPQ
jgi:hypothetical protein